MVARVPKGAPDSQNLSQNLSHDASCFVPSKLALQADEADENEYRTPVVVRWQTCPCPFRMSKRPISFGNCCVGPPSPCFVRDDSCLQSRKTSAAEPSGAYRTPDLGSFTRSVIQSLDNIKFTPSQGVCTPSPTIMVHHHHHVYGASVQGTAQDDQINNAYLAGLAAGRADAERKLKAGHPLIPAAMYDPSSVQMNKGVAGVENGSCGGDLGAGENDTEAGEQISGDGCSDDARSLDGRGGPTESESQEAVILRKDDDGKDQSTNTNAQGAGQDKARTGHGDVATSSGSKSSSPSKKLHKVADVDGGGAALHMAFALLSAYGVRSVKLVEDIPAEVLDLGSLLVTLEIPTELIMTPANQFCGKGGTGKVLNARQRRTLRRAQERAWKELEALQKEQATDRNAQPVRRSYSPTCLSYGVNPTAFSEYNGYIIAPQGMVPMPSPGVGPYVGPVAYQMFGPGHPQAANFAPEHPRGYHHGHPYYGPGQAPGRYHGQQPRTLSRFAER